MKILVTGSRGFVGKNLVEHLHRNQIDVVGIDLKDEPAGVGANYVYRLGLFDEIFHKMFIENHSDVEMIIHLASESHVDRSITGPKEFLDNNITGTLEIFELARKLPRLQQVILFSTDEVGACLEEGSFMEHGQDFKCGSVYSATKGAQELLAQAYINTHDLNIIITRCVNIFGPHQASEKFIPKVVECAMKDQPVPIYGNGMQMRQWVHVDHICEVLNTIAATNYFPPGSILHITGTEGIYNRMLAQTILGILGKPISLLKEVKDRLGHDVRYALGRSEDTDRFGLVNYDPNKFMEDLERTVRWYVGQ